MNHKRIEVNKNDIILLFLFVPIIFLVKLIDCETVATFVAILFWIYGMLYSIKNIKKHFSLFSFNIGIMVFLLGGYVFDYILTGDYSYFSNSYFTCSSASIKHACFSVMLSVIVVNVSYRIIFSIIEKREQKQHKNLDITILNNRLVKQVLVLVIVISFACKLVELIESLILVRQVTYYASGNYLSTLSSVLSHIASLYYISTFVYWSTFPPKKHIYLSFASLIVLQSINLLAGERGEPISACLVIILYLFMRSKHGLSDIRVPRKSLVFALLLVPFLMYGLQMISYSRNNETYEASFTDGIQEFVGSQGGSVRVISRAYDLKNKIEDMGGHTFVIGEIRSYLKNNVFARMLTGTKVRLRNVEDAYSGDNFLQTYGYAYSSTSYLNGVGSGSTYIAEVYHDGGYLFLFFTNIFYALLFCKLDLSNGKSVIASAVILNIFRYVPLLPRGMALDWLTNTFAIQNILIYLLLLYLSKRINSNKN